MINRIFTSKKHEEREKKFWKLKQLDRIEYTMQIRIIRKYFEPTFSETLNLIFMMNIILILFATLFLIAFKSVAIIQITPIIFKISVLLLAISLFWDIYQYGLKVKAIFKLRERFNLN